MGLSCLNLDYGLLHPVQVSVLAASHAFVFRSLERSLIGFPRLENGELLARRDVTRRATFIGRLNSLAGFEFRLFDIVLVVHGFLLWLLLFSCDGERVSERRVVSDAP